jgi:NAD(P)H dehydrogenase (quinone)
VRGPCRARQAFAVCRRLPADATFTLARDHFRTEEGIRESGLAFTFSRQSMQNETLEEARASRVHYGAPAFEVEGWVTSYAAIATGEMDVVTDDVRLLTDHEPIGVREFLSRS